MKCFPLGWPLVFALSAILPVEAADWPQYRGPNQDGASTETIRTDWAAKPPKVLWKVPLGAGLSSFSIANGRVFTMVRRRAGGSDHEFCVALHPDTGRELWAAQIGESDYPNGGVGSDDGTRSTPTVDGSFVYAFGAYMHLVCLEAATGREVWRRDLVAEFGSNIIPWQNAASPLVAGDLVFVNSSGRSGEHLIAFRKSDGSVAWKTGSDGMTHASPVFGTLAGMPQVVFLAQSGVLGVDPATGSVLWRVRLNYNGTSVAASPVIAGDSVYVSRAYPGSNSRFQAGALVLNIERNSQSFFATHRWARTNSLMNHWATPVHYNSNYYGIYGQNVGSLDLRCVNASNGATRWQVDDRFGYGSVTLVKDHLLVLGDEGELVLAEATPEAFREIASITPLNGRCWNSPAISNGRIYMRSTLEAVALDVSVPQPAGPLKVAVTRPPSGGLQLAVASADAMPIAPERVSRISVFSSDGFGLSAAWTRVNRSTVLSNGKLLLEIPLEETSSPSRFFRTEEVP